VVEKGSIGVIKLKMLIRQLQILPTCYLAVICAVEPRYIGHHWDPAGCPVQKGVPNSETQLYLVGAADSVLIREVPFIQGVLYRD